MPERSQDFNFDLLFLKEFAVPIALRTNGNGVTLRDLVSSTLRVVAEVLQLHLNHSWRQKVVKMKKSETFENHFQW